VDFVKINSTPTNVYVNGQELHITLSKYMHMSKISIGHPFGTNSKDIKFEAQIIEICTEVFNAIKIIKEQDKNEELAARLSSYLFEGFTSYWLGLLQNGLDTTATVVWHKVLSIANDWEKNNIPTTIHKGTAYFFLAENYLLIGDRDLAFLYLYSALNDDIYLGKMASSLNYPQKAPSYLTATMRADKDNQMYYLVELLRNRLGQYISEFNNEYGRCFKIEDFDTKFLDNKDLADVVSFFVFNFLYLLEVERKLKSDITQNEFARLRTLDVIFNLCLIIDETLKNAELREIGKLRANPHYITHGILWLVCEHWQWMKHRELEQFWGQLNLNTQEPDQIIPKLLAKKELYNNHTVKGEIFDLLLSHKLRNYGGHNIKQLFVFTNSYQAVIKQLIFALITSIEVL
jgi:hypothetical protein